MDHELLDVFDEQGWHRGIKPRDAVHRDGDWHRAFHLWVVGRNGVLLQRRARSKASWPGRLDATAAGHLLAGEQVRDGLREAEEELGVAYAYDDLLPLGVHRVDEGDAGGTFNREEQHVYAVRDDRPLEAWTGYDRDELDGLVLVGHDQFAALASGGDDVTAPGEEWDGANLRHVDLRADELVPSPYLGSLPGVLGRLARG
jgi:isopentenyldiphosphate isomerase